MNEIPKVIQTKTPEELPEIRTPDGKPVTREMLEGNPDLVNAIQNFIGTNIDMTPIPAPDSDSTPTP